MTYRAPVADIAFALKHAAGLASRAGRGPLRRSRRGHGRRRAGGGRPFATDVIAPLNAVGDKFGTPFKDGAVTTPPGWKEAYTAWAAAGWNGLAAPAEWGGQELPHAVNAACIEMWNSASMAFGIGPVLTMAAIDALARPRHRRAASDSISPKLDHRRMDGHDAAHRAAGRLRRRRAAHAAPSARATAAIASPARRSSSPTASTTSPTTSSISCWRACPTRRRARAASRCSWCRNSRRRRRLAGARNDVRCAFDRAQARHPRLADLHHGLWRQRRRGRLPGRRGEPRACDCMFTMMNRARLAVGLQGVGDRRARDAAGARLCARAQAGPRRREATGADHRASRRASACC